MSLKKEAAKGFFWVAIERMGQLVLQALLFVILARLLSPADFGLVAMMMVLFAISQSFIDSGMGQALIRQKSISDEDRSTVFWFNLLLSGLFYLLLYLTAPYVALFYGQPELQSLIRVMGIAIFFFGITVVQRAELTHKLDFRTQASAALPAFAIAGTISVIMAYHDFGVWALVAQYLLLAACSSLFLWFMKPLRILNVWSRESFNRLFGFGYKLFLSGLLNTIYAQIYKLVIGKLFSASTLGFYTQAQKTRDLITRGLMTVIDKVSYPLLSKSNTEPERLKENYRKMIKGSSFLIFPAILLLILLAKPIMWHILGEKWLPAVPYLQLICLHGILYHLHAINLNVLKVLGRSDLFLKLEIVKKVNTTIAIIVGIQFGIYGLLIGQVISSYVALFINGYYTARLLNYSYIQQGKDISEVLLLTIPMGLFAYGFQAIIPIDSIVLLIVCSAGAGIVYITTHSIIKTPSSKLIFETILAYLPSPIKKAIHL